MQVHLLTTSSLSKHFSMLWSCIKFSFLQKINSFKGPIRLYILKPFHSPHHSSTTDFTRAPGVLHSWTTFLTLSPALSSCILCSLVTLNSFQFSMLIWPVRIRFFSFFWRLITLQYCSGFCHTLTWISHGFTCGPHPEPPSHLPPHPISLGHPSAPAPSPLSCKFHTGSFQGETHQDTY